MQISSFSSVTEQLSKEGACCIPALLSRPRVEQILLQAQGCYAQLDALIELHGPWGIRPHLPEAFQVRTTASSLRLTALDLSVPELSASISRQLMALLEIDGEFQWIEDEAWLRRQYAPGRAPAFHSPHGWHQDGALGFDFLAADPSIDHPVRPMLTCWIPLVACGRDAPGICFEPTRRHTIILLSELGLAPTQPRVPVLSPGDGLIMLGGTRHQTHVHPRMHRDRISIELRYVLRGTLAGDAI